MRLRLQLQRSFKCVCTAVLPGPLADSPHAQQLDGIMPKGAKAKYGGMLALLSSALLCTAAAAAAATAEPAPTISPEALVGSMKMKVKQVPMESMPQPSNPYAGKEYAGCEGGYCPSADFGLELKFYKAADKGDVKAVRKLLGNKLLNITRNIVPDSDGFARVVDVAVWAASNRGHLEVMKVSVGAGNKQERVVSVWCAHISVCKLGRPRCVQTQGSTLSNRPAGPRPDPVSRIRLGLPGQQRCDSVCSHTMTGRLALGAKGNGGHSGTSSSSHSHAAPPTSWAALQRFQHATIASAFDESLAVLLRGCQHVPSTQLCVLHVPCITVCPSPSA